MVSALFEIFIGFTGLIGFLLRFIGPISIAPTITLIGVALFNVAADQAGKKKLKWMTGKSFQRLLQPWNQYKRTYQYSAEAKTSHEAILQNFKREYSFWQVLFPIRANVRGFKMQRRSSQLNHEPYAVAEFRQDWIFPGFLFATA